MTTWAVYFRRVAPYDAHTPLMYLPEETMGGFVADSAKEAWEKFLNGVNKEQRSWYQQTQAAERQMPNKDYPT